MKQLPPQKDWLADLDFRMTIEEAEALEIPCEGGDKSLRWFVDNDTAELDRMLDEYEPGSKAFYALMLVNAAYEKVIAEALNTRRRPKKPKVVTAHMRRYILPSALHGDLFE